MEWNEKYKTEIEEWTNRHERKGYDHPNSFGHERFRALPATGRFRWHVNWRLAPDGTGIRVLPDTKTRTCGFEIVSTAAEQSPGTINRAITTCLYPGLRRDHSRKAILHKQAQAARLGQQLYAIIYRDQWQEFTEEWETQKAPDNQAWLPPHHAP